jgi:tol-pal system-associated acyl-CoA thioesterase
VSGVFTIGLRVYIEDTDAGGLVYHANYLRFMERCRSDWLRALGFNQQQLQQEGVLFVVRRCRVDYHLPARLDDELTVSASVSQSGRASITFWQEVRRGQELLCAAEVKVASIGGATLKPTAMPASIAQHLRASAEA